MRIRKRMERIKIRDFASETSIQWVWTKFDLEVFCLLVCLIDLKETVPWRCLWAPWKCLYEYTAKMCFSRSDLLIFVFPSTLSILMPSSKPSSLSPSQSVPLVPLLKNETQYLEHPEYEEGANHWLALWLAGQARLFGLCWQAVYVCARPPFNSAARWP